MPKPNFVRRPMDKIMDMKINDLPNPPTGTVRDKREALWREWENIQWSLDQGVYTTTKQIEDAISRQSDIEDRIDDLGT